MGDTPDPTTTFLSLTALKMAHNALLQHARSGDELPAVLDAMVGFITRNHASGTILDDEDERETAQTLLTYWANRIYRAGRAPPHAILADFDSARAPELPDALCPYVGLDAFRETQQGLFYGRQRLVDDLIERLKTQRLLAVVGSSGSGKSSLVRAGLIPALREQQYHGQPWVLLPPMVPGSQPLQNLASLIHKLVLGQPALAAAHESAADGGTPDIDYVARLYQDPSALERFLRDLTPAANGAARAPALLTIDQFEEIFTLCTDEEARQIFLDHLLALVRAPDAHYCVALTIRSDFESFVARVPMFQESFEAARMQVPPLNAPEIREAIERPGAEIGLKFEPEVVDALLKDILGEPAGLPLLQFTLLKLWERRVHNWITREAYNAVGGGRRALANSADALFASLIPEEQVTARRILLRMARTGDGLEVTSNRIRRDMLLRGGEDPARVARVLDKLVMARLVRLTEGETPSETQVEVAHEALVRNWPTLGTWLEAERVALAVLRRLESRAEEWVRLGCGAGGMLDEVELHEAARWLASSEAAYLGYSTTLDQLIAESQRAVQAAQEQREATLRRLLEQQTIIDTHRLAFAAQSLARSAPETALLLAYEAAQRDDNLITEQALRDLLEQVCWTPTPLQGHTAPVLCVATSPDSQQIVTGSHDGTARLWDRHGALLAVLGGHTGPIASVAFSPDSQQIATGSHDGTARLWDRRGALLAVLSGHTGPIASIRFSADGRRIVTASEDRTARIWDMATLESTVLLGHNEAVRSAVFSPDGLCVATAAEDWTARIWDISGAILATLDGHTNSVLCIAFSPDGQRIVTTSVDRTARIWGQQGHEIAVLGSYTGSVFYATFSPDGRWVGTASEDGVGQLWDTHDTQHIVLRGHVKTVSHIVFSPDGQQLATSSADGTARIWDQHGTLRATLSGHLGPLHDVAFTADGRAVVTASEDGTARVWNSVQPPLVVLAGHTGPIYRVATSADGSAIVTASADGTARVWNTDGSIRHILSGQSGQVYSSPARQEARRALTSAEPSNSYIGPVYSAAFSPDDQWVIITSEDRVARLWHMSGVAIFPMRGHSRSIRSAAFSPDGEAIVTASADRTARLWNKIGQPLQSLRGHTAMVTSAVFSPDGARILTASVDGTARLWDRMGATIAILGGHTSAIHCAVFSPDGCRIISASDDGTARLWTDDGTLLAVLDDHDGPLYSACFSPDGEWIVTTSSDRTAHLRDAHGVTHYVMVGHTDTVLNAAFSPNRQRIITVSSDWTARLWNAQGRPLAILSGHAGAVRGAVFSPDSRYVVTISDDRTARQYVVDLRELLGMAAARVGRILTPEEVERYQVSTPLALAALTSHAPKEAMVGSRSRSTS